MVAIVTGNGLGLERSSAWILGARGQVGSAGLGRDNEDLYVNAATGNLVIHGNDEILLGRFVGANVGHTYNSLSAGGYDNGDNWMPDAARRIIGTDGDATITRIDWDGSEEVFVKQSTGGYLFKEGKGADDTLSFASNVWTWTDGDSQTTELYDSLNGGRITNVYSPMNSGLTYTYTNTFANGGKIDKITTVDGVEYVQLIWSTSGNNLLQLDTHTVVEGTATTTRVRYGYDAYNRLTSVTTDLTTADNSVSDGNVYKISYTYDDTGVTVGTGKRIASIAQQDGSLVQFTYALVRGDYRVASYTQTVSAGVTRATTFDYTYTDRTIVTDPAGQKTTLFYDSANRLTQISYPLENGNTTPRVVQFTYDSAGNVLTAKLGPGNIVSYDYDQDRLIMERDSAGNTVTRAYGTRNELLSVTHYLGADSDGAGSNPPTTPATTHYAYDTSLRMTFAVSADGHVAEYRYNDAGLRSVQIDYTADIYTGTDFSDAALASWAGSASKVANQRTDTTYDNRGNVSTVTTYSVIDGTTGAGLTTADYSRTTYVYDYGGRLLSRHTNADSTSEVFVYDGLGRLSSSTDFGGNLTKTYFLDSVGQTVLTHANGLSEVSTYNRAGELIAHSQSSAGGNLVDLGGWPGDPGSVPSGTATITNWQNWTANTDETLWQATPGPDGLPVVAILSGQHDPVGAHDVTGGGNGTNAITVDTSKAYEFTYYFKFIAPLDRHYAFFGLGGTQGVENVNSTNTANDSSAWMFYTYPPVEDVSFDADKWYKVVGYVLPKNWSDTSTSLGGVYDVATGQKVLSNVATFRWDSDTTTPGTIYARFANAYFQDEQSYSTYFYQPEIRQVSIPTTSVTGPDRTTSLYRYDNLGRLRMTVDPTGRRNYMMYDSLDRKVADIDADGSVVEYRYDGNDNLTSTTRYATRLSSSQLASLVDSYGNPTSAIYGASVTANGTPVSATDSLRPAASADDQWTFQVYDAAQRLRQTIDGTGATTVYNYDGASRLVSTKAYANRLSSTVIASLKAEASNPNLWANPGNAALWSTTNLTVSEFSTSPKTYIEGVEAFKFTVTNANQYEAFASGYFTAKTGDTVSYTISIEAVTGSITVDVTGILGSSSSWGNSSDSFAAIVSGPGTISQWTGGLFTVSGLTSDGPTRLTITRKLLQDESAGAAFYVRSLDYSATSTNDKVVVAAPVFTATHSTLLNLPDDDSTHDRVTRSFYDNDGRLIGSLDGEGYLTETRYDGAGRKTQTIAYWGATSSTYRADGTFSQLQGSITADTAKDIHNHFVYDPRGFLRATVDGEGILTRYYYTPSGDVYEVRTGQQLDPVALISTPPTFTNLPAEPSGAIVSVTNYAYDANHRPTDVSVTLTGSTTTTTTHHTYDSMGRLLSTTTQYGGTDPRTVARRYDLRGRLTGELDAIGYASLPGSPTQAQIDAAYAAHGISYAYDATDRLTSSTDANGRKTLYYYDTDGRLVYQIDPLGEVLEYRYDALGQRSDTISYAARLGSLTGLVGGNVTAGLTSTMTALASSTYDHVVHVDFNLDGTVKQSTDQLGNVTAYSYNGFGETEAIVAPLDASRSIETDTFYDRRGLLKTKIVDAGTGHLGLITTYGYDAFGRAQTLTNALSKDTTTTYDRDGRVKTITDALLNTTTNTWDSRGNLVAVTDAANKVTRFVYDKANRRIATIDARGGVVTSTYDADGRVVSTRAYSTAISLSGLATEVTESVLPSKLPSPLSSDQVTNYVYDKDGQLRFTVDALMHVVENRYDAVGNVIRTIAYDGTISAPSSYTESALTSAVASLASAAGTRITRSVYDAADRLSFAIDALGQVTSFVYDSEGRLIKQTEFAASYTATDDPSTATMTTWVGSNASSTFDRVTRAYYDRKGQLNFSIDALGYVTRMDYDKDGNVTKHTRYPDIYSATDSTTLANLVSNYNTPPTDRRETGFAYDGAGRLQQTTDPEGYVTRLTLDAMGRITFSEEAYGTTDASVTAYSYDDVGQTTSVTRGYGTADASTTWFFHDALGRQQARVDGDKYLTVWGYDDNGNCTSETHYAGAITGTVTATTSVTTLQGWAGSANAATGTHYDALNRIDYVTDARTSKTSRIYNALGEVEYQTEELESGTGDDRTTHWTYDSFGDAVTVTDPRNNQTISFYDKLGRVKRVSDPYQYFTDTTYTRGGKVASVTLWANAFTASTVTAGTYPGNPTADSTRDQLTVFTYDKDDRLTAVTDAENYTEGYTLNGFGERTDVRNKLYVSSTFDTTVHYTYDKRGLVLTETLPVTTKNSGGTTISVENHYEYDRRGNRKLMVEAYGAAEARTTNYQYDTLDRLIGTTHDAVSIVNDDLTTTTGVTPGESMNYDRRGNVIEKIDAGGARTLFWYDDLGRATDQLVQSYRDIATSTDKGTLTHTTYDGNGNALTVTVYGDLVTLPTSWTATIPSPVNSANCRLVTYAYDRSNRLHTTTVSGLRTGEFASGTWSFSTADIVTTLEYDMAGNVIHQEDGRGNDVYTWYDKLNRKVAQIDAENYLTTWSYNADGNVSSETRYANPVGSGFALPSASSIGTLPSASTSTNDRTTNFTYDRNGRRKTETRTGVAYTSVESTGLGHDVTGGSSIISYDYNGLGQVTKKTQTLDAYSTLITDETNYAYDKIGRLILETDPSFTDWMGNPVTPRTVFTYDGLGNLLQQRLQAGASANDTNDRITTYAYGADGRLATMTDAAGFGGSVVTHSYGYDKAGRVVRDSYLRTKSDNTTVTEAQVTRYDLAGRATVQTFARLSGSTWVFTDANSHPYDAVRIHYNAYGDVDGRGLTAGPAATAVYQETFDYDSGGRLWRSDAGDGVLRFYVYDKAGNRTLSLASTGADLSALTLSNYTGSISNGGTGDTSTTDAVTTISVFDKRGMEIQTREPDRGLSSTVTSALIVHGKTYNAFGEVATETDPRGFDTSGNLITFTGGAGYTTTYQYNTMGRLTAKISPQVSVTGENGVAANANPTEHYGYDLSGRLVSVTDANTHVTTRTLLAGSGHDEGADPLVTAEFHLDGGVARTFYDVFGDARLIRSELSTSATASYNSATDEKRTYDNMGRLKTDVQRGGLLTDSYAYDELGQRTRHTNDFFGTGKVEQTDYDAQGRVVRQLSFAGDLTTTAYLWDTSINDGSFGDFDGWTKTVTLANGKQSIEQTDEFGHLVSKTDFGGHVATYGYDRGGRMVSQAVSGGALSYAYYNTGRVSSVSSGTSDSTAYGYDKAGNDISEWTQRGGIVVQNASADYDALGRMTHWAEVGNTTGTITTAASDLTLEYDAVGNVRHRVASYHKINEDRSIASATSSEEYWYAYDSMNRFTVTKGVLSGTAGATGTTVWQGTAGDGVLIEYDKAGQRVGATRTTRVDIDVGEDVPFIIHRNLNTRESYTYDAAGYLWQTKVSEDHWDPNDPNAGSGGVVSPAPILRADYARDALGRVTLYQEYDTAAAVVFSKATNYNDRSDVTDETQIRVVADGTGGTDVYRDVTTNYYNAAETYTGSGIWAGVTSGGIYMGGSVTRSATDSSEDKVDGNGYQDSLVPDTETTNSLAWWDGAQQSSITHDKDTGSSSNSLWTSSFSYDAFGHIVSVGIDDGRDRTVSFITDANGLVFQRWEVDNDSSHGDPREINYYFNGVKIGDTSNNGTSDTDYVASMLDHRSLPQGQGAFRNGALGATPYADFNQSYDPLNGNDYAGAASHYTVQQGDTLQSVALAVWGDASMWYLIAEANGMSGGSSLAAGASLIIPNKVTNIHNNTSTFKVYDPNKAFGDLSPVDAKPGKHGGCGMVGQVIASVIAIAISRLIPIPIVGAVIGNLASQAFLIAIGQQSKINWKSVGITALSAAISPVPTGDILTDVATNVVANVATQGIAVATGLQKHFSWTGVAVAGVSAGISALASKALPGSATYNKAGGLKTPATFGNSIASSTAGLIAGAATRSVIKGTDFGDNLIAVLPTVIGQTVGGVFASWLGGAIRGPDSSGVKDAGAANGRAVGAAAGAAPVPTDLQIESMQNPPGEAGQPTSIARLAEMLDALPLVLSGADTPPQGAAGPSQFAQRPSSSADDGDNQLITVTANRAAYHHGSIIIPISDGTDGSNPRPHIEFIRFYRDDPEFPAVLHQMVSDNGGHAGFARVLFDQVHNRSDWDSLTTYEDLDAIQGDGPYVAREFARLQSDYDGQHRFQALLWGTGRFSYRLAGSFVTLAEDTAQLASDNTIGLGVGVLQDIGGVNVEGLPNYHREWDSVAHLVTNTGAYGSEVWSGRRNISDDLNGLDNSVRNGGLNLLNNIDDTYQRGGGFAVFNRYAGPGGTGIGIGTSLLMPGVGEEVIGARAANMVTHLDEAPVLSAEMGFQTEMGDEIVFGDNLTRIGGDWHSVNAAEHVERLNGVHDVVTHAAMDGDEALFRVNERWTNAQHIADAIASNPEWEGQPIRLVTCHGGCGPAQEISDILNVPVMGATDTVQVALRPGILSQPTVLNNGRWLTFHPQGGGR